jgi:hypothetical protein
MDEGLSIRPYANIRPAGAEITERALISGI